MQRDIETPTYTLSDTESTTSSRSRRSNASLHTPPVAAATGGGTTKLLGVRRARNRDDLGSYRPQCAECTTLQKWLVYDALEWEECPNDFCTYVCLGESLLSAHLVRMVQNINSYVRWLKGDDRATPKACIEHLDTMATVASQQRQSLYELLVEGYEGGLRKIQQTSGAVGWSLGGLLWVVIMKLRYWETLAYNIIRTCFTALNNKRKDLRILLGQRLPSYTAMVQWPRYHPQLDMLVDADLLITLRQQVPHLLDLGLVLLPDVRVGEYTQWQLWTQLYVLASQWCNIDPALLQLTRVLDLLEARASELVTHTWKNALCDISKIDASTPLDMPQMYHKRMDTPESGRAHVDLGNIDKPKKNATTPTAAATSIADAESVVSRAYIGEVLGMIMPMRRSIDLVPEHTPDVAETLLRGLCTTLDIAPVLEMGEFMCALRARLTFERSLIPDGEVTEQLCVDMRRSALPLGSNERFAYKERNMFGMTTDREQLENECLPRPVLTARNCSWVKLPLQRLEYSEGIPRSSRNYVVLSIMRSISFCKDSRTNWIDEYVMQEHSVGTLESRRSFNPSPFVLLLGARCFVRYEDRWVHAADVYEACALWLLIMVVHHHCTYAKLGRMYYCEHWNIFAGEIVDAVVQQRVRTRKTRVSRSMWDDEEEEEEESVSDDSSMMDSPWSSATDTTSPSSSSRLLTASADQGSDAGVPQAASTNEDDSGDDDDDDDDEMLWEEDETASALRLLYGHG